MEKKKTILLPVQREDFDLHFGAKEGVENSSPEAYFAPVIQQVKKLAVGRYFWFIADAEKGATLAVGGMFEKMMPLRESEFVNHSGEVLFRNTHPDDLVRMLAFTSFWVSFFMDLPPEKKPHVRPTIYIRQLNAEKMYNWVMVQYADHMLDKQGRIAYGLTVVTDIAHIKKDGVAMMSILDTYDDSCQLFVCADGKTPAAADAGPLPKISSREIDVLRLLAIGYSSKQIAAELKIAVKTTDNHRQSLLQKTGTKSSGELVAYGINMGFI